MFEVRVGEAAAEKIIGAYGPERSAAGRPSEWDFWSGPLAAALIGFRDFENLLFDLHPEIRTLHIAAAALYQSAGFRPVVASDAPTSSSQALTLLLSVDSLQARHD